MEEKIVISQSSLDMLLKMPEENVPKSIEKLIDERFYQPEWVVIKLPDLLVKRLDELGSDGDARDSLIKGLLYQRMQHAPPQEGFVVNRPPRCNPVVDIPIPPPPKPDRVQELKEGLKNVAPQVLDAFHDLQKEFLNRGWDLKFPDTGALPPLSPPPPFKEGF